MGHRDQPKEQQSLYLAETTISALRDIAGKDNKSVSQVADEMLQVGIEKYRTENKLLRRVEVLERNLPRSLAGVDHDHPVFGKRRKPTEVLVKRKWSPQYINN